MLWKQTPIEMYDRVKNKSIPDELEYLKGEYPISANRNLAADYKFLGVLEYVLHKDVAKYQENMDLSFEYRCAEIEECKKLREGYTVGDARNEWLIWSLLSKRPQHAQTIARIHHELYPVPQTPRMDVNVGWYLVFRGLILGVEEEKLGGYMEDLKKSLLSKRASGFAPYADLLDAIFKKDEDMFCKVLLQIADDHQKNARKLFDDYDDQQLCLRGISYCHLAQIRGMKIDFDHPMVPRALIELLPQG